jgi:hypothetical protein
MAHKGRRHPTHAAPPLCPHHGKVDGIRLMPSRPLPTSWRGIQLPPLLGISQEHCDAFQHRRRTAFSPPAGRAGRRSTPVPACDLPPCGSSTPAQNRAPAQQRVSFAKVRHATDLFLSRPVRTGQSRASTSYHRGSQAQSNRQQLHRRHAHEPNSPPSRANSPPSRAELATFTSRTRHTHEPNSPNSHSTGDRRAAQLRANSDVLLSSGALGMPLNLRSGTSLAAQPSQEGTRRSR